MPRVTTSIGRETVRTPESRILARLFLVAFFLGLIGGDAAFAETQPFFGDTAPDVLSAGDAPDLTDSPALAPAPVSHHQDFRPAAAGGMPFRADRQDHRLRALAFEAAWRKTGPPANRD